ncbi:MAG: serpin family protein [Actinomycetota bacterium]|nr:serpin family protein [Actinomycetota bacterium]
MRSSGRRSLVVLVAAALVACGGGGSAPPGPDPAAASTDDHLDTVLASVTERAEPTIADARDVEGVADATAAFALDLYGEVAAAEEGNVIVGPYSAWLALAMTSVGAAGATYDELAAALRFPLDEERLLPAVNALDRTLTHRSADDAVRFAVANRLWGQRGAAFLAPFLDAMVEHFGAPVVAANFDTDPEAARVDINGWVGERTDGKIPELFPAGAVHPSTRLVLVNAVHLDAPWEFAFDPAQTRPGTFTRADGSTVETDLMSYDHYLPTATGEGWAAVELPYEGGGMSMVVVVPDDLAAFEATLDDGTLDEVLGRITEGGVHLTLPRFSFSTHASLIPPLEAMGVSSAFDGGSADFTRMTEGGGLFVDAIEHEAFIEVDEDGTEAAAATGVDMVSSHGPTIDATRPFLFLIRDQATNTILFIGRVVDPSAP